jgi:ribosomal protein L37E
MEETRCVNCQHEYDQCSGCEFEDSEKIRLQLCDSAKSLGFDFLKSQCRIKTVNVKKDHCLKCGIEVHY